MTQLLKRGEVERKLRISKSTLYMLRQRESFPPPIKIGRDCRWLESEIEAWLAAKLKGRGAIST